MKPLSSRPAFLLLLWLLASASIAPAQALWKAGVARAVITPAEPLWMAGYAARTNPASGKAMDLSLKAIALEDLHGHRALVISADLLGFPQSIYQHTCAALKDKYGLGPDQILLAASHTHCGPVLRGALLDIYPLDDLQRDRIERYSASLEATLVATAGQALADLQPARLAAGQGTAGFAVNRRNNSETAIPELIQEGRLKGPSDHSVPVLAVYQPDGKLKALLFGYACHNTTLDSCQWSGDYAGFAQLALEKSHPDTTAMFFMGCGADQNPLPRRQPPLAERYGNMLAAAVEEVLLQTPAVLAPELSTAFDQVQLDLGPAPTEAELQSLLGDSTAFNRRWAARLLADVKAGRPFQRSYPFPLQVWRLGSQLLVTLGGEPVVDYALKFKREFGPQTWVAGYCNDVMAYLPSRRVLDEGGYEGGRSMIVYGLPAFRWADDVEDRVTASARRLAAQK